MTNYHKLPELTGNNLELMEESLSYLSSYEAKTEDEKQLFLQSKILGGYLSGYRPSLIKKRVFLAESLDSREISPMRINPRIMNERLEAAEISIIDKAREKLKHDLEAYKNNIKNKRLVLYSKLLSDYFSR